MLSTEGGVLVLGFKVQGLGFRVYCLGRVQGLGRSGVAGKACGTLVAILNLGVWAIGFVEQMSSKQTEYGLADCFPKGGKCLSNLQHQVLHLNRFMILAFRV